MCGFGIRVELDIIINILTLMSSWITGFSIMISIRRRIRCSGRNGRSSRSATLRGL